MKKLCWLAALIIVSSCNRDQGLTWFSADKAGEYFRKIEAVCKKDNGNLWAENLYGPVMFVDGKNRAVYTNMPDREGLLKARDGIFTGILPDERIITNNVIDFGGVRYAMVPLPDTEDEYRILTRAVHSLFHCYQERHTLKPLTFSTRHLNEKNARLYLKLEWKALTKAIGSDNEVRRQSIRDALVFREARRELFPDAAADENKFENYEGLATFTSIKLCTSSNDEMRKRILEYLDRIYKNTSYVWGYGFVHGALYATLLDDKGFEFKQIQQSDFDLGHATLKAYDVAIPEVCRDIAGSLAMNYDINAIMAEENERNARINEHTRRIVSSYFEKPVMTVTMESPNFSFEPEDISFLDTLGTLYEKLRVSDNWGRLAVDKGGALLTNDLHLLRLSARDITVERNHIYGDGWHMILNDGWQAVPEGNGNYIISNQ